MSSLKTWQRIIHGKILVGQATLNDLHMLFNHSRQGWMFKQYLVKIKATCLLILWLYTQMWLKGIKKSKLNLYSTKVGRFWDDTGHFIFSDSV